MALELGKVMSERSTTLYGHVRKQQFAHLYPAPGIVEMCGSGTVYKFAVRDLREGEVSDYWAWWNKEKSHFQFVYPSKMLVEVCFPYALDTPQAKERGELTNVVVELVTP